VETFRGEILGDVVNLITDDTEQLRDISPWKIERRSILPLFEVNGQDR